MDGWYYKLFGDEFGPIVFDELVELAKSQTLTSDCEVRFGETGPWRRAGSMGQLTVHMPAGAHLPSANGSSASPRSEEPAGWYYQLFGDQFGPVAFEDLEELAKNHTLSVDDQVRFGENGVWRRAGSIGKLMAHLPFQAGKNAFSIEVAQGTSGKRSRVADGPADLGDELDFEEGSVPLIEASNTETVAPKASAPAAPTAPEVEPSPAKVEDVWWCMIEGKEYGPVDLPKLVAWAASGRLHRKDYVRHGLESYVIAGELPGLFPELPVGAVVETKTESVPKSSPRSSAPRAEMPSVAPSKSEADTPEPAADTPKPATNWQMNSGGGAGGAMARPVVPIRKPPAKKGGGLNQLLVPLIGVVGVVVLGGLIYLALPLILGSADAKRFNTLRTAYNQLKVKRQEDNAKKEDIQAAAKKLAAAAKPIETELKGKTGAANVKLRTLAKKLQDLAKEDLTKPTDAEKDVEKKILELKRLLKLKD